MRILIAGAAGFIGSHLCQKLLDEGNDVIGIDNFLTSSPENIAPLFGKKFIFIKYDVTHFVHIAGPLDAVIHLASPASPEDYRQHPIHTLKVGSLGTHNLLGLSKEKRARFLLASTSEVYGDPQIHPQPENYWGNVNPTGLRGVYDEAKRFAEAMSMAYHRVHGLDVKIARIFNTYGPLMRLEDGRAVPNFILQALEGRPLSIYGTGKQTRSFCYVDDLVEGITRLLKSTFQGPMNLGDPLECTILDLAKAVLMLSKAECSLSFLPLPEDDPKVRQPDITLAKRILGWEPKTKLEEGLKKTFEWTKNRLITPPVSQ